MSKNRIELEFMEQVAHVCLNRPDKHNASDMASLYHRGWSSGAHRLLIDETYQQMKMLLSSNRRRAVHRACGGQDSLAYGPRSGWS